MAFNVIFNNNLFVCILGIIDILSMEMLNYGTATEKQVKKTPLTEDHYPKYWTEAKNARVTLIDKLTNYCDDLANIVISSESLENIATVDIVKALSLVTLNQVQLYLTYRIICCIGDNDFELFYSALAT